MSLNAKAYDMLKNNPRRVAELKKLEDASNGTKVRYIPTALLNNNNELREVIHDGDIIAIVTNKRELDTTHLGFAVWHDDGLHHDHRISVFVLLESNKRNTRELIFSLYLHHDYNCYDCSLLLHTLTHQFAYWEQSR